MKSTHKQTDIRTRTEWYKKPTLIKVTRGIEKNGERAFHARRIQGSRGGKLKEKSSRLRD